MFYVPILYPVFGQITDGKVDGSWFLGIVVVVVGFLITVIHRRDQEQIRELKKNVGDVEDHMHKQDITLAKICQNLGIED